MGITWCRERLEQAQNSKNPVDRILIRCSNAMKPKTYSRSQDRLADDIVFRGVRKDNLQTAPPRSRNRLRGVTDWQTCALTVPEPEEISVAPVPPPRKKRKRRMNGEMAINGSEELFSGESRNQEDKENTPGGDNSKETSKAICNGGDLPTNYEQRRQNRFKKLSENRGGGKIKTDLNGIEEKQQKKKEQRIRVVKNVSTVSLPNYNDLVKPTGRVSGDVASVDDKARTPTSGGKPSPRRNQSTMSLPGEATKPKLSALSEATIHRLETYMKRCRSFGSLKPQQLLEKLEEFNKNNRYESESSDSWSGLDDWDMGVIEYCDPETANLPPLTPKSTLPPRNKIFSVGTPQETPRRQSPVSEIEEEEEETKESKMDIGDVLYNSDITLETVPNDWFSENQKTEKLQVEKERTKTPPPSPANGPAEAETVIENDESQSSLLEILTKYKDEELNDIRRESVPENSGKVEEEEEKPKQDPRKLIRNRSYSLIETHANLLQVEELPRRSPSIGLERTTRLLDELTRNSEAIEKELLENPEHLLNGLRRASLRENLPEDPFEVYISRKKPSLRESLSLFLGFNHDQEEKKNEAEEKPPPLPVNPPPIITTSPPEAFEPSCPLVTITCDDDPKS